MVTTTSKSVTKSGPFYKVAENAPAFSILTAMIYLVGVAVNFITKGALDPYMTYLSDIMLFGALLALPLAVMDIAVFGLAQEKSTDIVMMGFTNYFALLINYAETNWEAIKPIVDWVKYIYLVMFIVGIIIMLVNYMVWRSTVSR